MTPLLLATAFTPEYKRAPLFIEGLEKFCNIPYKLLVIGRDMPDYEMPGSIVQAGFFLDHLPPCEVVVFTDADLMMHREIGADEIEFLMALKDGKVAACYNMHPNEIFEEELGMLYQRGPTPQGYSGVRVMNTGFVAARTSTYRAMFEKFKELWTEFDGPFEHYAKIQLCMCCAVARLGLEWVPVPSHLCAHGHFGAAEGVDASARPPTHNGRVICMDHRLTH